MDGAKILTRRVDVHEAVNHTRRSSVLLIGRARGAVGASLLRRMSAGLPADWDVDRDDIAVEDLAVGLEEGDAGEFSARYVESVSREDWEVLIHRY